MKSIANSKRNVKKITKTNKFSIKQGCITIIEGNISAGRSHTYKFLCKKYGCSILPEPAVNNPYLELFYGNKKRYAFKMQIYLLLVRFVYYTYAMKLAVEGFTVVLDQSIYSDIAFSEKNRKDGNISQKQFEYYISLRKELMQYITKPDLFVFLDCDAEICLSRIKNMRGRDCECTISIEYLKGLGIEYSKLVQEMKCNLIKSKVKDWNKFGSLDLLSKEILESLELKNNNNKINKIKRTIMPGNRYNKILNLKKSTR